jgi:hypothetical protein
MAEAIAATPGLGTKGFVDLDVALPTGPDAPRLSANRVRTFARVAEQAIATLRYENALRRA